MSTITRPLDTGSVTLTELSKVTADYLRTEVEVQIGAITRNLRVDGDGTFVVRATNSTADRGVRLHDVTVHLEVDAPAVVTLSPPAGPAYLEARATGDRDDPRLSSTADVPEMFIFFPPASTGLELNDVLDPGESIEFEARYHGESAGTTDITAHIHATVAVEELFPRTTGATVEKSVTIKPPPPR